MLCIGIESGSVNANKSTSAENKNNHPRSSHPGWMCVLMNLCVHNRDHSHLKTSGLIKNNWAHIKTWTEKSTVESLGDDTIYIITYIYYYIYLYIVFLPELHLSSCNVPSLIKSNSTLSVQWSHCMCFLECVYRQHAAKVFGTWLAVTMYCTFS